MADKWNIKAIHGREALALLTRKPDGGVNWGDVEIAHLDTGATRHSVFGPWNQDQNDAIKVDRGRNYIEQGQKPFDPLNYKGFPGHGTRIASVLCGDVPGTHTGVAPDLPTVPYRVTNTVILEAKQTKLNIAQAIRDAVDSQFEIISMSLGMPWLGDGGEEMGEAADYAYENGVLIIAAGGQVIDRVTYPGKYWRTVGVGGVSPDRTVWHEYIDTDTDYIDVWAPADEIYRANMVRRDGEIREGEYQVGDGTSYATVHVSGTAAMWLVHRRAEIAAKYNEPWKKIEAFKKLLRTSRQAIEGDYQPINDSGLLHAENLLKSDLPDIAQSDKENRICADMGW